MAAKIFLDIGDQKIPAIGLGMGQLREKEELERTFDAAIEIGYRHFDTAYMYLNEALIGPVLKKWFSSGKLKREDIFITTKLPMAGVHEDRVELFMKKSLESLQLDYVDLYLIHFPIGTKNVEGRFPWGPENTIDVFDHVAVWKKMEEQVDAGRAKNIGLSNFNQRQIERVLKNARIKPTCLQIEVHVDFQQRELVNYCQENGIVVVAYSPLGAPGKPRNVPLILADETINQIAAKYKKTSAQIMLRYLLQKNIVAIPKTAKLERLKENIDVFDFTIKPEDIKSLDDLEGGEEARLGRWNFITGIEQHPEYPFPT